MSNEAFFQQFQQMFNNPFQRRQLVEYFDKLVQELTKEPKPMRVAMVGTWDQFKGFISKLWGGLPAEIIDSGVEHIGGIEIIHVNHDKDAQGIQVDCYCFSHHDFSTRTMEICAYMAARNIPCIRRMDLYKEFESRLNIELCLSELQ